MSETTGDKFTFTGTGDYVKRNGNIVYGVYSPLIDHREDPEFRLANSEGNLLWRLDGSWDIVPGRKHPCDLVARVNTPPTPREPKSQRFGSALEAMLSGKTVRIYSNFRIVDGVLEASVAGEPWKRAEFVNHGAILSDKWEIL